MSFSGGWSSEKLNYHTKLEYRKPVMSISNKIYQSKMLNEVLAASSVGEIQNIIDTALEIVQRQQLSGQAVLSFTDSVIKELESLHDTLLPYNYHSNIITALVHMKQLKLQGFNVVDESFVKNV